jgi:hypothetical protein
MGEYDMSYVEFPPSTIGQDFACGLSGVPIDKHEVLDQIKRDVCASCPFFNRQCIPDLPRENLNVPVIAIRNCAGSGFADLPALCALIQGGTLYMHNAHWHPHQQDMLI